MPVYSSVLECFPSHPAALVNLTVLYSSPSHAVLTCPTVLHSFPSLLQQLCLLVLHFSIPPFCSIPACPIGNVCGPGKVRGRHTHTSTGLCSYTLTCSAAAPLRTLALSVTSPRSVAFPVLPDLVSPDEVGEGERSCLSSAFLSGERPFLAQGAYKDV